ncbi:MAG: helix-turn-helix transcriptional regulator [Bacteroides sp.]|nr:helix-turn-helix transcriptional regulator [Ruminococcus flavefaciens]MCM1554453.1 helix-turn-helix transcriptional regulator [Bacteroides sp.]
MKHNPVWQQQIAKLSPESIALSQLSFDVADRIAEILKEKGMSQKDLATGMGKTEAEVSKWLGGTQNFTLKTIATISTYLQQPILTIAKT